MSPQELYREEKRRHERVEERRWQEHAAAIQREERRRGTHPRLTQGEGRGLFHKDPYE